MSRLSSWGTRCSWKHCGACSACNNLASNQDEEAHQKGHAKVRCESWCSNGLLAHVKKDDLTVPKAFTWDTKCEWNHCGACESCHGKAVAVNMRVRPTLPLTERNLGDDVP